MTTPPEELGGADRDKRAPGIDKSRQPIGHTKPETASARKGSSGIANKQRKPVERMGNPGESLCHIVCKQA